MMSNQIVMLDLLEDISTQGQEFLVGGQLQGGSPPPNVPKTQPGFSGPPTKKGATGYIVPDDNPEKYYSWRLELGA